MTSRFVVESPFQVLMAVEAAIQHDIPAEERELVVLWPGESKNRTQIRSLLEESTWASITEVPPRRRAAHMARSRAVRQIAAEGGDDPLFIGDHESPLMRHLANRSRPRSLHLLDDGLRTVAVHQQRSTGANPDGRTPLGRVARRLAALLLRLDVRVPGPLDYFTVFDLEATGADTVTRNDLSRLRARVEDTTIDHGRVLFLGGPEAELGGMAEDDYIGVMGRIRDELDGQILYAPHRRESPHKLARLESELSLSITVAAGPIEWELTRLSPLPGTVASFLSTALITIPLVVDSDVELISFRMPDSLLAAKRRPVVAGAHETLVTQSRGRVEVRPVPH